MGETTFYALLTFASYIVIPVHERALRIVSPGPDVQFEECSRYTKPIWTWNELETLAFELWRHVIVSCEPTGCVHDVLDT